MKRFIIVALSGLYLLAVSCYDEQIDELNNRIDKIENEKIATIQEQVASISTSILDIQKMNTQLQGYITVLQDQAKALEESLSTVEKKIDDVESEMKDDMDAQKVQILATLEDYKTLVSEQLSSINTVIADLQVQKEALENQIKLLKEYINGEIQSTEDWASATFATLENYNALAAIISGIQVQIETLNSSITDIDANVMAKVAEELATAIAGLRDSMKEEIEEVAKDCSEAINSAKEEITSAYEAEIKAVIATSEANMKSWVNTQLAKYYTATQVDSKLSSLKSSLEIQLENQKTYLMGLIRSLEQTLTARIEDNCAEIDELNGSLTTLSSEVAMVAGNVASNASSISANAESIRANAKLIADNAKDNEVNTQLINANKKLIEDNNALIKANQAEMQTLKNCTTAAEAAIAANAESIVDNSAAIAANASLIAQNATAISNNSAAIAANAQEIENLKVQLQATKEEITEAYKATISTAITTLDGKLSGQIATEVAELNSRIDTEVATINAAIGALTARVATCEKDIKSIMTSIYNMQTEISDIQEQIEEIFARIQSVEYIPIYSDRKAVINCSGLDTMVPWPTFFYFDIHPAAVADELAQSWNDVISMRAVYTQSRALIDFVELTVDEVIAENGILAVKVSCGNLDQDFFRGNVSASACLVVSDGNNEIASEYVDLIPQEIKVIEGEDLFNVAENGSRIEIPLAFNYNFQLVMPEDAAEWVEIVEFNDEVLILNIVENATRSSRSVQINLVTEQGVHLHSIRIVQEAGNPYVDEYGVNHGLGILIGGVVWAPVNCGYKAIVKDESGNVVDLGYPFGKLYQWGRKYGQGYNGGIYDDDDGDIIGSHSDASFPTVREGGVTVLEGNQPTNANVYFSSSSELKSDWTFVSSEKLWNSGTEEKPKKTEYDPCPEGWRVPTLRELNRLTAYYSGWRWNKEGYCGYAFSGSRPYSSDVPQLFLPAAGFLSNGKGYYRGNEGDYWTSKGDGDYSRYLYFDGTYTVKTNASVGRSRAYSVRCVQDRTPLSQVNSIELSEYSVDLVEGDSYSLSVSVNPLMGNSENVFWYTDDPGVVTVDQNGVLTAVAPGNANITVVAGMQKAMCAVFVEEYVVYEDYIDEYGVNHGKGVRIGQTIWAPVNCGYHTDDFKYGKLYQWGREYGQGYDGDALVTELVNEPASKSDRENKANANKFFCDPYVENDYTNDWDHDPCPSGWGVPTMDELYELSRNHLVWIDNEEGQSGYRFIYDGDMIFLPAAGCREYKYGECWGRGSRGYYRCCDNGGSCLYFSNGAVYVETIREPGGASVRCVQR